MNPFYSQVIGAVIRHALGVIGAAGTFSENDVQQLAGAVAVLISISWSIYQKSQTAPPAPVEVDAPVPLRAVRKYGKRDK